MPDRESPFPGAPSQPNVPPTGDPPPASSGQAVRTGAVAVAALVFVVGGLAWAYHLVRAARDATGQHSSTNASGFPTDPTRFGSARGPQQGTQADQQAPQTPAASEPEPLLPLSHRVNQAIDRGVAHLRQDWHQPKEYQIYLGLLGLTLLECGVPRNDPAVGQIADLVRSQQGDLDATQELSLAILFLDRLGDPNDDGLIRTFARRLLEGQDHFGCWGYACFRRLPSLPAGTASPPAPFRWVHAEPGDNINTQFAVLGLWVATAHGVSVGEALRLTARYYRKSQGEDGSWTYRPDTPMYRHSMTCAGLFCLAAELGESPGYVRSIPPRATLTADDPTITRGLRFLGKSCDAFAKGGTPEAWDWLYFLWSLERVAAVYGLETIGSQEWYPWTAELLVRRQRDDGSWWANGTPDAVPTCFALLILRRSNLPPDLLVRLPDTTRPQKPVGVSGQPLVQEPSSVRVPAPVPELRTKPGVSVPGEPPAARVPDPSNRLNRTDEKKD
jgi:hypothetical protein